MSDSVGPCSPPGSSVHGIVQARILEWAAMPFSRGSSGPRDLTQVSRIAGRFFTAWATGIFNLDRIIYIYICMCVCIYICMYVCMYVRMYATSSFFSHSPFNFPSPPLICLSFLHSSLWIIKFKDVWWGWKQGRYLNWGDGMSHIGLLGGRGAFYARKAFA